MVLLAGLDLIGALLAKRYADHRSVVTLIAGIVVFGALFLVYVRSLSYAELATVTFGWVVMLQVGVVVIDQVRAGERSAARSSRRDAGDGDVAGVSGARSDAATFVTARSSPARLRECRATR